MEALKRSPEQECLEMKARTLTYAATALLMLAGMSAYWSLGGNVPMGAAGDLPVTEASAVVGGIAALFLLRRLRREPHSAGGSSARNDRIS